jgi:hypothetical protein
MRELLPLTAEQLAHVEHNLRNPAPDSRIEAARKYGICLDLTLDLDLCYSRVPANLRRLVQIQTPARYN